MLNPVEEQDLVRQLRLHHDDRWLHLLLKAKCKKVGGAWKEDVSIEHQLLLYTQPIELIPHTCFK